jgi:hypothetical protein
MSVSLAEQLTGAGTEAGDSGALYVAPWGTGMLLMTTKQPVPALVGDGPPPPPGSSSSVQPGILYLDTAANILYTLVPATGEWAQVNLQPDTRVVPDVAMRSVTQLLDNWAALPNSALEPLYTDTPPLSFTLAADTRVRCSYLLSCRAWQNEAPDVHEESILTVALALNGDQILTQSQSQLSFYAPYVTDLLLWPGFLIFREQYVDLPSGTHELTVVGHFQSINGMHYVVGPFDRSNITATWVE